MHAKASGMWILILGACAWVMLLCSIFGGALMLKFVWLFLGSIIFIAAFSVAWDMALDRLIAHVDRWHDAADDLIRERR